MSTICLPVTVPDRSADTVSSMTAAASTVTDSPCDPTSSTIGGRPNLSFTKSFTSVFLYVLKPASSAVTVNVAAGRALKR